MNTDRDYHVHSSYNDHSSPDLTIQNAIRRAEKIGLKALAFTEHVRRASDWIPRYLEEIDSCKNSSKIEVISGFEAKILKDGTIDCPGEYSRDHFVIASFHTTFGDKQEWVGALKKAIRNPDVDVIGHIAPEPAFELDAGELDDLASLIKDCSKTVELNAKYHRPPAEWIRAFSGKGVRFHAGSDAHALQDIGRFEGISDLIALVNRTLV